MSECERLDEYLNGDLSEHQTPHFTAHLAACEPCRAAIDQQQWIDDLLRRSSTVETFPVGVVQEIERGIVLSRKRRCAAACGLAALTAAASLLIALSIEPSTPKSRDAQLTQRDPTPVATFVGSDDMIVVQHESPYPNVTIVELYPTVDAVRRWQNEAPPQSIPPPQHTHGDPS